MCFVDRKERNRALPQGFEKRPAPETFRRDVDEFEFAPRQSPNALALFSRAQRAIDQGGGNAAALECIDLIFHQRDQRRNDYGGSFQEKRRELITERFAAA